MLQALSKSEKLFESFPDMAVQGLSAYRTFHGNIPVWHGLEVKHKHLEHA